MEIGRVGVWTFEFWHQNRKIGEQPFCVVTPPSSERNVPPVPAEESCRLLLTQGIPKGAAGLLN